MFVSEHFIYQQDTGAKEGIARVEASAADVCILVGRAKCKQAHELCKYADGSGQRANIVGFRASAVLYLCTP